MRVFLLVCGDTISGSILLLSMHTISFCLFICILPGSTTCLYREFSLRDIPFSTHCIPNFSFSHTTTIPRYPFLSLTGLEDATGSTTCHRSSSFCSFGVILLFYCIYSGRWSVESPLGDSGKGCITTTCHHCLTTITLTLSCTACRKKGI